MTQKKLSIIAVLVLIFGLAACSNLKLPWAQSSNNPNQQNQAANFGNMPVEDKLAVGTLRLEGTDKAVTPEQAKALLPLWRAAKSMSTSDTASTDEINALYKQIQETMSVEQVQSIKDMNLSQEDIQALMQQYGIQGSQGGPTPNATQRAQGSSNFGGAAGGGPGGGPGDMPPDAGGGPGGFPGGASGGQQNALGTPQAGQAGRRAQQGMNTMFLDALIKLLEVRAGA